MATDRQPLVSVVIPTYNRRRALQRVLEAWERQRPHKLTFEVVVVDDGSDDGTADFLAAVRPDRFRLRVLRQDNAGPAAARNLALELVRGGLVLFTGDDIEPDARLLLEHVVGHREDPDHGRAVLGLTRWPDGIPLTATMRHVDGVGAQQFSYHYLEDGLEYDFRHFYTSNVSLRRSLAAMEPAGFSTEFPAAAFEDAEFAYRLSMHGLRIRFRASAVAYHHHSYDVRGFWLRQRRCGEMAVLLARKHPALTAKLGIAPVERRRTEVLAGEVATDRMARVEPWLERWEHRALGLAAWAERTGGIALDPMLHALFELAYAGGVADARFSPEAARMVRAAEFLRLMPPAIRVFAAQAARGGVPLPSTDVDAISGLDSRA